MTLCRRGTVYLNQKGNRFSIEHPHGTITVTCHTRANQIFDKMTINKR